MKKYSGVLLELPGWFFLQSLAGLRRSEGMPTATYCVVLDCNGETHCAVGDMDVLDTISPEWVSPFVVHTENKLQLLHNGHSLCSTTFVNNPVNPRSHVLCRERFNV